MSSTRPFIMKRLRAMSADELTKVVRGLGMGIAASPKKRRKQLMIDDLVDYKFSNPDYDLLGELERRAVSTPPPPSLLNTLVRPAGRLPQPGPYFLRSDATRNDQPVTPLRQTSSAPHPSSLEAMSPDPVPYNPNSHQTPTPNTRGLTGTIFMELPVDVFAQELHPAPLSIHVDDDTPFEDIGALVAISEEDAFKLIPNQVKVLSPARPPRRGRTAPSIPVNSEHILPDLPRYREGGPYDHCHWLSDSLARLTYWARTSAHSSKATRPPTTATLEVITRKGIVVKPDSCNRLQQLVLGFRDFLNSEDQETGELRVVFERFQAMTKEFLKGPDRLEGTFSHHLYACLQPVITRILRLNVFDMVKPGWDLVFEPSGAVDLVIEPRKLEGELRTNPPRDSARNQRQTRLFSSPMFKDINPNAAASRRAKAEEQQRGCLELKTERSGDDGVYEEGLFDVETAAREGRPLRLSAAIDPDYVPTAASTSPPPEVLMPSEPLNPSFSSRLAQVMEYLFGPVKMNSSLNPAPYVLSFNGKKFWIAFRTGEKEMEITKLFKYDGNVRFVEALATLAWAQSIAHPLVYSGPDQNMKEG